MTHFRTRLLVAGGAALLAAGLWAAAQAQTPTATGTPAATATPSTTATAAASATSTAAPSPAPTGIATTPVRTPTATPTATSAPVPLPKVAPYMALGDSLAVGVGATDRAAKAYVGQFAAVAWPIMKFAGSPSDRINLAVGGETTASMLATGRQLDRAVAELTARRNDADPANDVRLVTLDIGGDDVLPLTRPPSACVISAVGTACQAEVAAMVTKFGANLPVIVAKLRQAAGPDAVLVVATVYNPFSGTGTPFDAAGDPVLEQMNAIVRQAAADAAVKATVADIAPAFKGKAPLLTHIAETPPDIHPNDAGYRTIVDAFTAALRTAIAPVPAPAPPVTGTGRAAGSGANWLAVILAFAGAGGLAAAGAGARIAVRRRGG